MFSASAVKPAVCYRNTTCQRFSFTLFKKKLFKIVKPDSRPLFKFFLASGCFSKFLMDFVCLYTECVSHLIVSDSLRPHEL